MPVEIKQLTVNSSITDDGDTSVAEEQETQAETADKNQAADPCMDVEEVKADILSQCRDMVRQIIENQRER